MDARYRQFTPQGQLKLEVAGDHSTFDGRAGNDSNFDHIRKSVVKQSFVNI